MKAIASLFIAVSLLACNNPDEKKSSPIIPDTSLVNGEQLFKINCAQCHRPAQDFAAPALAGVEQRWANKKLLYEFIRNSQEVIARDKYASDLFEKWNKVYMQPFPQLSDDDINAILKYCDQQNM